jgi:nuclear mRNA export protein PCID2/THP1
MSLQSFLDDIVTSLRNKNGQRIADLIHLDVESLPPQKAAPYVQLNSELNSQYPKSKEGALLQRCRAGVTPEEFGTFSTPFCESIRRYFSYLRDVQTADNLTKALEIRQLTSQCVTALGDARYGIVMIPIVLSFSRTLAFIATKIDRNPQLLRQNRQVMGTDASAPNSSMVEDAANVLRDAFIKCLAGSPGTPRTSRPQSEDKRVGIYLTANSTLKLLFQCLKHRNAQQLFTSIDAQSPPLAFYPAAQRTTYLYYLGRYHFANNHFLRASAALQAAYKQCHRQATSHLKQILTYLIASNLILGLLPTRTLFNKPYAQPLHQIFGPLISAIRSGDLGTLHAILSLPIPTPTGGAQVLNPIAAFLLKRRIHLQLLNRLSPLVWRSLILRTFSIAGYHGSEDRKIPFLRLPLVRDAARFSFTRAPIPSSVLPSSTPLDAEFAELDAALAETGFNLESGVYEPNPNPDFDPADEMQLHPFAWPADSEAQSPSLAEVEAVFMSLIQQGLLKGFVLRNNPRFAIPGANARGGWRAYGFPNVHRAILAGQSVAEGKGMDSVDVPGWVKQESLAMAGGARTGGFGGRVVNLSSARPVGAV